MALLHFLNGATTMTRMETHTDTIEVRVLWGSKSSGGKWGRRAIDEIKQHDGVSYDPGTKLWTLPADIELSTRTWEYLEVVS